MHTLTVTPGKEELIAESSADHPLVSIPSPHRSARLTRERCPSPTGTKLARMSSKLAPTGTKLAPTGTKLHTWCGMCRGVLCAGSTRRFTIVETPEFQKCISDPQECTSLNPSKDSHGLTGTIPTELGKLAQLTILYLYNNALSGTIPTELGLLTELTEL